MSDKTIPAFPSGVDFYGGSNKEFGERGMTLRDYFAAKALQGDWAAQDLVNRGIFGDATYEQLENAAKIYYRMADAMLKERAK